MYVLNVRKAKKHKKKGGKRKGKSVKGALFRLISQGCFGKNAISLKRFIDTKIC